MLEALKVIIFGIVDFYRITEGYPSRYCGGNHGMAADQQHGASDLVGRITAFETKSGVS